MRDRDGAGGADKAARVLVYVPHGDIPDRRGFSPSIVACEFARRTSAYAPWLVCSAEGTPVGCTEWEHLPLRRLGPRRLYRRLRKLGIRVPGRTLAPDFLKACRSIRPALLHIHQLEFDLGEMARRYGAFPPVVLHAHVLSQKPCSVRGLAHHYIAVSDYVANGLADMGYPAERITTIRNGVDTNLFIAPQPAQVAAAKERLGVSQDTPVLAFVGRKHDVKGYPAFLQVAQRLLLEDRRVLVLAVGADPERPSGEPRYAAARTRERGLAADPRFRSIPALPHPDLAALYQAIDVTLMPSLAEPQGMAMIESLAAGCITISSRVGGIGETIEDGVTGFLVDDPRDVDLLYARTAYVLDNLEALAPLRRAARSYAVQNLDWSISARRLEVLYQHLLA